MKWSNSIIVPVFKKSGYTNQKKKKLHRFLSLVSNLCKLFISILNGSLLEWTECKDDITDDQFGFNSHIGSTDAIFALYFIISSSVCVRKRLYRATLILE